MGELIGPELSDGTDFDWIELIVSEFNTQSVPVLKRSCISSGT